MTSPDDLTHEMPTADGKANALLKPDVPNVARMWDYYLGGTDNTQADRDAARVVLGAAPDVPLAALENREFLRHAVQFLVEDEGICQFIDIGPGLPTQGNVHQLARRYRPDARVAYVDNDPVVLDRGRAHLDQVPGVTLTSGDLRRPEAILADPQLREIIDFTQPVGLCMTLVLHFITDADDPYGIVARLRDALPAGSYLVISHVTGDDHEEDALRQVSGTYDRASAPLVMRSRAEFLRFFDGFELAGPGVVFVSQWRPATSYYAEGGTRWAYAGVGRKAGPRGNTGAA